MKIKELLKKKLVTAIKNQLQLVSNKGIEIVTLTIVLILIILLIMIQLLKQIIVQE